MDRRKFIKNTGRYVLLSGLLAIGGTSIYKSTKATNAECDIQPFCQDCNIFSKCELPQALNQRKNGKK